MIQTEGTPVIFIWGPRRKGWVDYSKEINYRRSLVRRGWR